MSISASPQKHLSEHRDACGVEALEKDGVDLSLWPDDAAILLYGPMVSGTVTTIRGVARVRGRWACGRACSPICYPVDCSDYALLQSKAEVPRRLIVGRRFAFFACLLLGFLPATALGSLKAEGSVPAGSVWSWRNPLPQGNLLRAVSCDASGRCVAVGDDGAVVTSSGGPLWNLQSPAPIASPRALVCPSPTTCVAVGMGGSVLTSADGGRTWAARSSGTSKDLEALSCASPSDCVAVGLDGAVIATANGGSSWSNHSVAASMSLWGVSCPTVRACVAAGTSGRVGTNQARPLILVSANGGSSWGQRQAAPTGSLAAVACWSTTGCVVTGSEDASQWTNDGGATWSRPRAEQASDFLTSLSCPAAGVCVALGMSGVNTSLINSELPVAEDHLVERTSDGGRTWQHKYVNGPDWPSPLVAISCPSSTRCVGVGGYGTIKASSDGGGTWTRQGTGPLGDVRAITCPSPTTCYAVGEGVAVSSTDGGKTWVSLPVSGIASTVLKGIACTSTTTCLIVGGADTQRTSDGGKTWATVGGRWLAPMDAIDCPTSSACVGVGGVEVSRQGAIHTSTNGGTTWQDLPTTLTHELLAVACHAAALCVAVGHGGTIAVGSPDGTGWLVRHLTSGTELHGVACPSAQLCLVVGDHGKVLRTRDGGKTWSERRLGDPEHDLLAVGCTGEMCLVVGSSGSLVYTTTDGGATWAAGSSGYGGALYGVACMSAGRCLIAGEGGAILASGTRN